MLLVRRNINCGIRRIFMKSAFKISSGILRRLGFFTYPSLSKCLAELCNNHYKVRISSCYFIYFLTIFVFSLKTFGQNEKGSLFSQKELQYPLDVKVLDLSRKSLKELPSTLLEFKNLEEIVLGENPNLDLFGAFQLLSKLKKLKELDLAEANDSIPYNISTLTYIEKLNLEKNHLTSIPEGVKKLTRLRELSLWDNKINTISLQSGDLPNLEEIELGLNKLEIFPDDLSLISTLKKVSFFYNSISNISPVIKELVRLEDLNFRGNKLRTLPPELGELKALKKLDLGENQLSVITPLLNLSELEELILGDNRIESIPDNIRILSNLKKLLLYSNPIKAIPEKIAGMQSLNYISIDCNDSTKLPAYLSLVATLPELKTLSIGLEGLKEMPKEFENLTQINNFLISDCDMPKSERKRLRALFPKAYFYFYKSWGNKSFYKYKPCTMDESSWDTISVNNFNLRYLLIGQNYRHTDDDGIHYWHGEILLNIDKKSVDKKTAEKILLAIADRLQMEDITAARTCRTFGIMRSAIPLKSEEVKKHYEENFIGTYYRRTGLSRY
jgi:Leucine-rich repeat (LRR) protein